MASDLTELESVISGALVNNVEQTLFNLHQAIQQMQTSGMSRDSIKQTLVRDLERGGMVFGGFKAGIRSTIQQATNVASQRGAVQTFETAGVKMFRWIVVSDNPCPDCIDRNGQTGTMKFFRDIGMPGSGFSVCGKHCHCRVVPEGSKRNYTGVHRRTRAKRGDMG
jgi:hypothetical protein